MPVDMIMNMDRKKAATVLRKMIEAIKVKEPEEYESNASLDKFDVKILSIKRRNTKERMLGLN